MKNKLVNGQKTKTKQKQQTKQQDKNKKQKTGQKTSMVSQILFYGKQPCYWYDWCQYKTTSLKLTIMDHKV